MIYKDLLHKIKNNIKDHEFEGLLKKDTELRA